MAVLRNTELVPLYGTLAKVQLPIAASQTVKTGAPVYLNSGRVTRVAATTEAIDTGDDIIGWIGQDAQNTLNGSAVSLGVDILVNVYLATKNIAWCMPSYGGTPAITNFGTSYAGYNDAETYKVNVANTTNPVFVPFAFDLTDTRGNTNNKYKSTFSTGDRLTCALITASFKQVDF